MAPPLDGDLGVDVLIIGGGIQGLYIARELAKTYSVCVVSDPSVASSTLDSSGYFSAGYDGNDANRIQPARRAAGWWRLWAETNRVPFADEPPYYVVAPAEVSSRTRLWTDAMLATTPVAELPDVFADGSLDDDSVFRADTDVVIDPATILSQLREGLEARCIDGEIVRFGLASDDVIDHVQVQVGDDVVPIVPRFVVLAAGVGNADLLSKLGSRFADQAKRKSSKELVESSQAVRSQYVLCVRGRDLPEVNGRFGDLLIASHTLTDSGDRVWLVAPKVDDSLTTAGPDNLRFERPIDSAVVAATVDQLLGDQPGHRQAGGRPAVVGLRRPTHAAPDAGREPIRPGSPSRCRPSSRSSASMRSSPSGPRTSPTPSSWATPSPSASPTPSVPPRTSRTAPSRPTSGSPPRRCGPAGTATTSPGRLVDLRRRPRHHRRLTRVAGA